MQDSKFSIVVPTMWRYAPFVSFLKDLVECHLVDEILLIDNDKTRTPDDTILNHAKIKYYNFDKNIYVNPAWNLGVNASKNKKVCIMNDDVIFDLRAFDRVNAVLSSKTGVMGLCPGREEFNHPVITNGMIDIVPWNGEHTFGFGCLMFIHKDWWEDISDQLTIYYGDNWIFDTCLIRNQTNYLITNMFHYTPYASTTKEIPSPELLPKEKLCYTELINQYREKMTAQNILNFQYEQACRTVTDINDHLPILRAYAEKCTHVTEMGVRTGMSTRAFLPTDVVLRSYDLYKDPTVEQLFEIARSIGKDATYQVGNTLELVIDETDMLFIDTCHRYDQLIQELNLHAGKVRKFIAFHDTHTFGTNDEPPDHNKGLLPAIIEFMIAHPEWQFELHRIVNNGLTIIKRV